MHDDRISRSLGSFGEDVAARFLERRGLRIVDRNAFVDRDEIDIVYEFAGRFVAVEVKTTSSDTDPIRAIDDTKMHRVRRAVSGYHLAISGIDAVGVAVRPSGVEVRWLRGIG